MFVQHPVRAVAVPFKSICRKFPAPEGHGPWPLSRLQPVAGKARCRLQPVAGEVRLAVLYVHMLHEVTCHGAAVHSPRHKAPVRSV
jgi:hypothetical protein